ncbi:MAG: electron transport complex subunit E, partial [Ruminococcus sp.]|nr:electron transport complex subunit E [Ruminococcus sp.]
MNKERSSVFAGITWDNMVLSSLMVISPVIVCGDTLRNAEALVYAFSSITMLSVCIASFVPKKLPYALKVIIYALISSLVFIPVKVAAQEFYPGIVLRVGIYFPLLAVN